MNNPTIADIKQVIHKIDLTNRPYIVFLNPEDAEAIKAAVPGIEKDIVIHATLNIERGKGFVMKREDLEVINESYQESHSS